MRPERTTTPDDQSETPARATADAGSEADIASAAGLIAALQETNGTRSVQRLIGRATGSQSAGPEGGPLEDDLVRRIQAERSNGRPQVLAGLDILHEPQIALTLSDDANAWLAGSLAVPLLNQHMHIISQDTELQLAAQMNVVLQPHLGAAYGGTAQLEQHVWKGISATFSVGGMWTPARSDAPGHLDWSANGGMTVHFDGF
jgi:hypothetical protein